MTVGARAGGGTGTSVIGRTTRTGRARHQERWFYLLVAPWLAGLVLFQTIPIAATVGLAFTEWQPPLAPRWTGLDTIVGVLADPRFLRSLTNTIWYAVGTVVPGLILGLGIALLLFGAGRAGAAARAAIFLPAVIAGVATALMWGWILNPRIGLVDGLLGLVGIDGPAFLADPAWALPAMVAIGLWNLGVNVVVYTAALGTVPRELIEAAAIDGAGRAGRLRHVVVPSVLPVTAYLAVVNAIGASQVFTPVYVLTGGGPDDATLTTAMYTYRTAFEAGRLGDAAGMTVVVLGLVLALTGLQWRLAGRRVPYVGAAG